SFALRPEPSLVLLALVAERAQPGALLGREPGRSLPGHAAVRERFLVGLELAREARGELRLLAAQVAALRRVRGEVVERVPAVAAPEVLVRALDPGAQAALEGRAVEARVRGGDAVESRARGRRILGEPRAQVGGREQAPRASAGRHRDARELEQGRED